MTTVSCMFEIAFEEYGGAECFPADIDGDGIPEILTYQGPGIFGPEPFRSWDFVKALFPKSVSVSAFRADGQRLWTWGTPNPSHTPYISHSYEACIATGDIDGDGRIEVVVADGNRVVILDGETGEEVKSARLPDENYYILQTAARPTDKHEAAIAIKNGEAGNGLWRYGEPVLGLNADLEPVWGPKAVPGGGHHILSLDVDDEQTYLIGYCAMGMDGQILWTVDAVDPETLNADQQHVDYTDVFHTASGPVFSIAASDKLHLFGAGGRTYFSREHIHCQGTALGRFRSDSEFQVALYNSPNGPVVLYDPSGVEIWSRPTERVWPMGFPKGGEKLRMHRNRPIIALRGSQTWIGYADGGWPWGMDGDGEISLEFSPPANAKHPDCPAGILERTRLDDIGYSYAMQVCDMNNDGREEALVYDRRFMWVYALP